MQCFVINLERDAKKRQHMEALFLRYGLRFERVEAVDGRRLDEAVVNDPVSREAAIRAIGRPMTPAEIGVALSHISIYRKMLEAGIEMAVVLEDDIDFDETFVNVLACTEQFPADWEVVLLGHHAIESPLTETRASFWGRQTLRCGVKCMRFAEFPFGTYGYLINLNGVKKLMRALELLSEPIDHYTGNDMLTNLYGIMPACIRLDPVLGQQSNVKEERDRLNMIIKKPDTLLRRSIRKIPYLVRMAKRIRTTVRQIKPPRRYKTVRK